MITIFAHFRSDTFPYIHYAGTHVAGIIAANATGKYETGYTPYMPFIGIAPQVTIGACKFSLLFRVKTYLCEQDRVLGCSGYGSSGAQSYSSLLIICKFMYRCHYPSNLSCLR